MRYKFDELKTQILARLPDNSTGQITPAVLRGVLLDFVDSVQGAYVAFTRTNTQTVLVGTTLAAPLDPLFDAKTESAPDEVTGDLVAQSMTVISGSAYEFVLSVVATGAAGERLTIGLVVDGVPYEFFQTQGILPAGNEPLTLTSNGFVILTPGQVVQTGLKVDGAPAGIEAGPCSMLLRLIPSRV